MVRAFFDASDMARAVKRWGEEAERSARDVDRRVAKGVWDAADAVLSAAQKEAPTDRSGLRHSGAVRYGPGPTADVTFKAPYAKPVEFGSRPHMPPVEPLVDWVMRQGRVRGRQERGRRARVTIKPTSKPYGRKPRQDEAERVAWAIAMKIRREGTAPDPFLQRAIDRVIHRLPELIGRRVFGKVLR